MSEVHYHETGCQCGDCRKERGDHAGYEQALVTIAALRAQNAGLVVRVGVLERLLRGWFDAHTDDGGDAGAHGFAAIIEGLSSETEYTLALTDADAAGMMTALRRWCAFADSGSLGDLRDYERELRQAARALLDGARC